MKIKNQIIMKPFALSLLSLALIQCGFGGKNSDPMRGQNEGSFVSQSQKNQEQAEWERKFQEETSEYQESIKAVQEKSKDNIQTLEKKYQTIQAQMNEKQNQSLTQCRNERNQFSKELVSYKSEQDSVIKELQSIVTKWEDKANSCEQFISNPDKQNFQGLLYQFNLKEALPPSLEWTLGQNKNYDIFFKLDLGQQAMVDLQIIPALPKGLKLVKKNGDNWSIEGKPEIEIREKQNQTRSVHYISPVLDLSKITDETIRNLVKQQTFEEKVMIVIQKTEQEQIESARLQLDGRAQ